jgi:succinate-acetate transporter protein
MTMEQATADPRSVNGSSAELAAWEARTRVFLQPIAPPSILGLFGFAAATFIVSAHLAGWYGSTETPLYLAPFAAVFGGVAQFAAGMFAFRARDGLATAMHGMWGSFWIAFGILNILGATGALALDGPVFADALAYWFFALAAITLCGTLAAAAESVGLVAVLGTLAVGAALLGIGYVTGSPPEAGSGWLQVGGYVLIASAILATYAAAAMMMEGTYGRVILPLGKLSKNANVPGHQATVPIEYAAAEPGVRHGQ